MTNTPHVMIIGEGAEAVARDNDLELVDNSKVFRLSTFANPAHLAPGFFSTEKVKSKW